MASSSPTMAELPNLVLLTIDALRADHVYGYDRPTTPEIDAFGDENITYTQAFAPSSHTREAAPPLLTGRWPEEFSSNNFQQIPDTLPVQLNEQGYQTGAFHSNPYLSRAYGYDDGFEEFFDDLYFARHKLIALAQKALDKYVFNRGEYYARAPEINRRSLSWLDSTDEPVFLWNHYMDVHGPYHAPERRFAERELSASEAESLYRKAWETPDEITETERTLLEDSYDDEIRYLDSEIGSFLEALRERELLDDSLVVLTADHGEVFGEYGQFTHPRQLNEELLHVPLMISPPEDVSGTVETPVSTIDVAPTLADAVGGPVSDAEFPGEVLVDDERIPTHDPDRRVFASVGTEADDDIRRFGVRSSDALLRQDRNVESNEVISEQIEPDQPSDTVQSLRESLNAFVHDRLEDLGQADPDADPEVTDEIESRLESLGYK